MTASEEHAQVATLDRTGLGMISGEEEEARIVAHGKSEDIPLGRTIPDMFWHRVEGRRDKILLRQKKFGVWRAVTWKESGQVVREVATGLMALGLEPGDRVSIASNTVEEWLFTDFAVMSAGGISSGIYPTDAANQVEYLLSDSGSQFVFVEDDEQLDKVLEVRGRIPALRKIIVFDMEGLFDFEDEQVISYDALRELGIQFEKQHSTAWSERRALCVDPGDTAILVYTSGTTGKPKGACLSHRSVLAVVGAANEAIPQYVGDERMAFLPLCHVAERSGCYSSMAAGTILNFVENYETVPENIREISPTIAAAVPRVWEKFYSSVRVQLSEATALQRFAYNMALGIGVKVANCRQAGATPSIGLSCLFRLADFLVLGNVKRMIGLGRTRVLITGAAPISPDLLRWYMALGIKVVEVWGQTETAGVATATPLDRMYPGTVGKPVSGVEVRLSDEGELLVRGDSVFSGYLNMPEKTAETIIDGWLRTGDVATIDERGFVRIVDRMKDMIITAGGKNITPSEIENELKFSPYITDAVVIGEARAYLTSLVMIDQENVEQWAQENSVPFSSYASLCNADPVQKLIEDEIKRVNDKFARVEQIKRFRIIDRLLTAEDDELTPTMKLKRKVIHEKYSDLIESMYQAS